MQNDNAKFKIEAPFLKGQNQFFILVYNFDEFVRSLNLRFSVIPAKLVPAKAGSRNPVFSNGYKFSGLRFSPE